MTAAMQPFQSTPPPGKSVATAGEKPTDGRLAEQYHGDLPPRQQIPGASLHDMATLQQLQLRKRELEDKLHAGDLSVEPALELIDRAISGRTLKVQHSRQRLEAAKQAVAAGLDKDEARRINSRVVAKKLAEIRARQKLNRF